MNTKRYDVFIAYHGTYSQDGSYEKAKQLADYLTNNENQYDVYLHGFTSLPEHKDVQWNRTWEIVDKATCFIAVVNDNVPMNSNGYLGNEIGERESQLRAEVDSFYDLVNRNMRSRAEFNFFYAGTKLKNEQQIEFFRTLHSQVINGHNEIISWNEGRPEDNFYKIKEWLGRRGCCISKEEKQLRKLRELLEELGWGKSIFFSPSELLTYEGKISAELKSVTLIAANTTDDIKGGKIFPLVAKNIARNVKYSYLFFEYPGAKRQLESIYANHCSEDRGNLDLKLVKSNAWFSADIYLVKIYEFYDERPEIFFRIKMSTSGGVERCIYVKGDDSKIPIIQQEIDDLLETQTVITYSDFKWN